MLFSCWALNSLSLQGPFPRTFSSLILIPGSPALARTRGLPNSTSLPAISTLESGIVNQTVVATMRPTGNGAVWKTHGCHQGQSLLSSFGFLLSSKKFLWRTNHQTTSLHVRCSFSCSDHCSMKLSGLSPQWKESVSFCPLLNTDNKILRFVPPANTRNKPRPSLCQNHLLPLFLSHILGWWGHYFVEKSIHSLLLV